MRMTEAVMFLADQDDAIRFRFVDGMLMDEDFEALRERARRRGIRDRDEAEMLLALDRMIERPRGGWERLLIDLMSGFLARSAGERGAPAEADAEWLIRTIGEKPTPRALHLLIHLGALYGDACERISALAERALSEPRPIWQAA